MNNFKNEIEVNNVKYPLVFDLNVMALIQKEYGTIDNWGKLTDGVNGEVDAAALIFGLTKMINEGIDIENDNLKEPRKFLTEKQVGRLITQLGYEESAKKLQETVIESSKSDEKN